MNKKNLTILFTIIFQFTIHAEKSFPSQQLELIGDTYFSPYAGGEDLLFVMRLLEKTENYLVRKTPLQTSKRAPARATRLVELLSIWWPLGYESMLVQHEILGHGFRIRSLGSSVAFVNAYQLNTPPPYGNGGGSTSYTYYPNHITLMEQSSICCAGVEATAILANLTKFKWLAGKRSLDPREAFLYLYCQQDLSGYADHNKKQRTQNKDYNNSSDDIEDYLFLLNATYPNTHLSHSKLHTYSLINYLDPFTYFAIWSSIHYISSGHNTKIPMIPLGSMGYLFAPRMGLTPFGPEFFIENYFAYQNRVAYGYIKAGNHANNTYLGLGMFAPSLIHIDGWDLGVHIDVWRQPILSKTSIEESAEGILSKDLHKLHLGASLSATISCLWKCGTGIEGEVGMKSSGFLPGYPLQASPTIRGGIFANF